VDDLTRALARLDSDEGLRRDLVARGLSRTLDFSWTESAQRTLEIYRDLADGRRP
jgi:glycosyltransferase involved in cell wall biosynthesis